MCYKIAVKVKQRSKNALGIIKINQRSKKILKNWMKKLIDSKEGRNYHIHYYIEYFSQPTIYRTQYL